MMFGLEESGVQTARMKVVGVGGGGGNAVNRPPLPCLTWYPSTRHTFASHQGEVAEWPKAPDSKSGLGASPTWVRLPLSPLDQNQIEPPER